MSQRKTLPNTLNYQDRMVLKMIEQHATIREMAQALGRSSTNTVSTRIKNLIQLGYVNPPPKAGQARAYSLTQKGIDEIASPVGIL